jgi:hypothetical protein
MATKSLARASFISTLAVLDLSFWGFTATHHMLLPSNISNLTLEDSCASAHPSNIAANSKHNLMEDLYMLFYKDI